MDKVIKIEVTTLPRTSGNQTYRLQIIEQSYIRCDFGNPSEEFISSKGFILRSIGTPAVSGCNMLYVWGDRTYANAYTLTGSSDYLRRIMHAVREYNSHLIITDLLDIPEKESFIVE